MISIDNEIPWHDNYIEVFPKIELHAHLYGSLPEDTLIRLHGLKYGACSSTKQRDLFQYINACDSEDQLTACFQKFKIANDLIDNPIALAIATAETIKEFDSDGVMYLELRTTPKQTPFMTKIQYLDTVLAGISNATGECKIMVKLLVSIDRSKSAIEAMENVTLAGKLRLKYPDIVLGIDFSGDPKCGEFETFTDALSAAKKSNLKLAVHCGEIEGKDSEISAMLKFGIDRIGHGTFIKGDNLDFVYHQKIPMECCISSNILCGTVKTERDHPVFTHFILNHPVCICTDDAGVFNTNLTKELTMFNAISNGTFIRAYEDVIKVTYTAISAAFCSPKEKETLTEKVQKHLREIEEPYEDMMSESDSN